MSDPLPYDTTTTQEWLNVINGWSWQVADTGRAPGWWRGGACPRCAHQMDVRFEKVQVILRAGDPPPEVYIQCNCTMAHTGRPDEETGCGQAGIFPAPTP